MKQFILPAPPDHQNIIRLGGKDYHYLTRVRRLAEGDVFTAQDPRGTTYSVTIQSIDKKILTGVCRPVEQEEPGISPPRIILFQAIPKGTKMDLIVRQAAEGGISEIVPFTSEYSVPHPDTQRTGGRVQRWERIIREARQQSGSLESTTIVPPTDVSGVIDYWESLKQTGENPAGILLHQDPLAQGTFHGYLSNDTNTAALVVGPEGGFSRDEADRFVRAGFKPLVIGNTILRTETAALYAAAVIRVILLEKASWMPIQPL